MAGRPARKFDTKTIKGIERMARSQCRDRTIAKALGIPEATFRVNFGALCKRKRAEGRAEVLMAQFKSATSGNVTAEIWWGKQHLKQTDRQDVTSGGATLTLHEVLTGAIANGCNDDTDDE